jgi:hypothetical protein
MVNKLSEIGQKLVPIIARFDLITYKLVPSDRVRKTNVILNLFWYVCKLKSSETLINTIWYDLAPSGII